MARPGTLDADGPLGHRRQPPNTLSRTLQPDVRSVAVRPTAGSAPLVAPATIRRARNCDAGQCVATRRLRFVAEKFAFFDKPSDLGRDHVFPGTVAFANFCQNVARKN